MAESPEQSTSSENSAPVDGTAAKAPQSDPVATDMERGNTGPPPKGTLHTLWTLFVRLLILGFGVSCGWILGVLVAQVFPSSNPDPPLQERVMRYTSQTWRKVGQLPQWWRSQPAEVPIPEPDGSDEVLSATAQETPGLTLSPELQEQVEAELAQLQTDLATLESRLAELETNLGEENAGGTLETRIQRLGQMLNASATAGAPATLPPPPIANTVEGDEATGVYAQPPFSLVTDSIVLPNSLLFEPGESLLTPAGQQLLNTIVPDLQRYPSATLLVGSHVASDSEPQADRKLSFQQAMAVQQYLDQQLAEAGVHWVTLGYGQTRPRVAGSSPQAQQRNQRVEIGIVP